MGPIDYLQVTVSAEEKLILRWQGIVFTNRNIALKLLESLAKFKEVTIVIVYLIQSSYKRVYTDKTKCRNLL